MKKSDEKTLDFPEQQIPDLMMAAVTIARYETLAAGHSVVQLECNEIIEQFPNGTKRVIQEIDLDRDKGQIFPEATNHEFKKARNP